MYAQLPTEDLAEALEYPFCTGEAEQIALKQLNSKIQRDFGGDVWKFVEQADALGIKDIGSPAQRLKRRRWWQIDRYFAADDTSVGSTPFLDPVIK